MPWSQSILNLPWMTIEKMEGVNPAHCLINNDTEGTKERGGEDSRCLKSNDTEKMRHEHERNIVGNLLQKICPGRAKEESASLE